MNRTDFILRPIESHGKPLFIQQIQTAFQQSYIENCKDGSDEPILPVADIEASFNKAGSHTYFAERDGKIVGGAVVVIDEKTQLNHLDLLYTTVGGQNRGTGSRIWQTLEQLFPDTKIWETHTPYFDKRNIHFYVNRCGFKIVEFFNEKHPKPENGSSGKKEFEFFRFEKEME